ncbi:uncharacterized protein LOC125064267 [Vanessa atalanta]|uniref:uncharacterized protein LOC125064267 n=1 Tax=Vanessa atalanta TaxID=42275 RepID=UPI001FCD11A5|nr:uncharacterized protein LOC125064267 [Vanessa atalanta]
MLAIKQILVLIFVSYAVLTFCEARPDSAGHAPLPGPGLSYGGIPYGSMSGNVAEYYRQQGPSIGRGGNLYSANIKYAPIEQFL